MLVEPMKLVGGPASDLAPAIPGLVWAFRLHNDGSAEPLPTDTPIELGHDGRLWLHFNLTDARARSWLAAQRHSATGRVTCCCRRIIISSSTSTDHCVYGVFSDLVRDIDAATEETGFLALRHDRAAVWSAAGIRRCAPSMRPGACWKAATASKTSQRCSKRSSTRSPTRWTGWRTRSAHEIDDIEERILAGEMQVRTCVAASAGCAGPASGCIASSPACVRCSIASTRRTPTTCRRTCVSRPASWRSGSTASTTISSSCANAAACFEEELRFKNEEESNNHLHTLSIVTSLLLPPTLITGIFGMNTKGLPLTDVEKRISRGGAADGTPVGRCRLSLSCGARASSRNSVSIVSSRGASPISPLRRLRLCYFPHWLRQPWRAPAALAGAKDESAAEVASKMVQRVA